MTARMKKEAGELSPVKFKVRSLLRNNPKITREEIGIQIRKNKRTVQRIANG